MGIINKLLEGYRRRRRIDNNIREALKVDSDVVELGNIPQEEVKEYNYQIKSYRQLQLSKNGRNEYFIGNLDSSKQFNKS